MRLSTLCGLHRDTEQYVYIQYSVYMNSNKAAMHTDILVSDGMADVVDVVYVNIVTWSMGCVGAGEVTKGEQLIANQGQEWGV